MQNKFNIVLNSIHTVQVQIPKLGDVTLPEGQDVQLIGAPIDTVNYLRNTFTGTGVKVFIGRNSAKPYSTYSYEEVSQNNVSDFIEEKPEQHMTPLEKVANFEMPSGKHQGEKLKDIDDDTLRTILRVTKTPVVKSAISAYLNLK